MHRISLTCFCLFLFLSGALSAQSVLEYVDVFIGTAGDHGQLHPAASAPFGMVKLGPDTRPQNHAGYDYTAKKISGFSHNRIGGVGCNGAGGNLRFLPATGWFHRRAVRYDKTSEVAEPAYYRVVLKNGIQVELTAAAQTGIHRYRFPDLGRAYVRVDLESSFAEWLGASYELLSEREFIATVRARNVCDKGRYTVYYHIWCNQPIQLAKQLHNQLFFQFDSLSERSVLFHVTASTVSAEAARAEWEERIARCSFEEVRDQSRAEWYNLLSRIQVEGKEEYKTLFYTHLYRQFLNPVRINDSSGQFRGSDGKVYRVENRNQYSCWSMWDNFRNKFALYALIAPEVANDIAHSLADLYQFGKNSWSSEHEPVPTVRTEYTLLTLLDLYRRGINGADPAGFYDHIRREAAAFPADSPDKQLEKAYNYWAVAQFARLLEQEVDHRRYLKQAMSYRSMWRQKFLPITEQSDVMHADGLYEGTFWQYRWHIPFDTEGLLQMIGGPEILADQLEYFFEHHLYNHGNQPDIHAPYLFNFSSRPWLTQKWVRKILTDEMIQYYGTHRKWPKPYAGRIYRAAPAGYIPEMDDDEGTMSAWYVLSAMGLYPVRVGIPEFQLSSPIFEHVLIRPGTGKEFEIRTIHQDPANDYIQSIYLNGKPHRRLHLLHKELLEGGALRIELGPQPDTSWWQ